MTKRQIFYTADLVLPDGSDTTADGDYCGEGQGYSVESGWWDPDWSYWQVHESRDYARPDEYDAESEGQPVAQWAAECLAKRLKGWPEGNGDGTYYSGESYAHPYEGKSICPAAHFSGFKRKELRRIAELIAQAKKG